jgi:integrase/ribosomal protein L40E
MGMSLNDCRDPDRYLAQARYLTKDQLEALKEFEREKAAQGTASGTRYMYFFCLCKLANFLKKPFKEATKSDLIDFFKTYSWYKSPSLKVSVKAFYKWLYGGKDYPECVSWIKTNGFAKRKLPEEILTKDEVKMMAEAALNPRDRALILTLYESGARAGELITLKIKHIQFDEYGAVLMLNGKTGMRRVRIIDSVPDLKVWLNHHPRASDPEAPLFTDLKDSDFLGNHATLAHIINSARLRAGLKKNVYPHLFRHSRATHLAKDFTEQELKVIFGWSGGSRMPATYVHLSGADVDNKMLEKRGLIRKETPADKTLEFKVCERCGEKNTPVAKFCNSCGLPIGNRELLEIERTKAKADRLMNVLMKDEEFRDAMVKKIMALGLGKELA